MRCGTWCKWLFIVLCRTLIKHARALSGAKKHSFDGAILSPQSEDLVSRLSTATNGSCKLFTSIGARSPKQRRELWNSFNLDHKQPSTLHGPLKPRCDLWEVNEPEQCTLVLDLDICSLSDDLEGKYDRRKILKLLQRSNAVLLHVNAEDIEFTASSFRLNRNFRNILKELLNLQARGNSPKVYIFLPSLKDVKKDHTSKDIEAWDHFKKYLLEHTKGTTQIEFKTHQDEAEVYRVIAKMAPITNTKDVAKAISMAVESASKITNSTAVRLRDACFNSHRKILKHRLANVYRGTRQPDFGEYIEASMLDATLALYLRTMDLDADEIIKALLDQEYKQVSLFAGDAYLRMVMISAGEAKSKLRKELGDNPKQDTNALMESILTEYDQQLSEAFKSLSSKLEPPQWVMKTVDEVRTQLKQQLESIVAVHNGLPSPVYSNQERMLEDNHMKNKKDRGISMMLFISCMLREHGYGNRQGYINYQLGPVIFTLGYANDRDVAENKPGTGLLTPAFRIQPRIHFNIKL
ncbi:hypothetical protein BBOV_I000830 [Babesia bovis T2Bo]|uniref:Uncharacterized protein n=1 Tax=Babesia bovis TaxID=5865 RepID=A7AXA4_BABBO|nr:hypothetical protein BBOV_I000830 [Babesia bovis T2Bo]EDO05177.1 hypothetical protein BBOV_I000830 [Babesia bovis T2Bo]|eukprot:XP_001608745.1 hypothetical protein [Babesia bovis T2Bo]